MAKAVENPIDQEITEITLGHIQQVRDELKRLTSKWAMMLAGKMFPEIKEKQIARERLYNIVNGSNRSLESRVHFLSCAKTLKDELQQVSQKAANTFNSIVNS